ncbi:MAG: hypothetical protein K2X93_23510 [Candidatus Obscuribacterales bacterium]|nr:hypothetical protein [Candidatus Obscuribacterales bacterium]
MSSLSTANEALNNSFGTPEFFDSCLSEPDNEQPDLEAIEGQDKSKSEQKPKVKPDAKPESKPGEKPDVKPGVKPDAKPDSKPSEKPDVKPEVKPESKADVKKEVKPEPTMSLDSIGKLVADVFKSPDEITTFKKNLAEFEKRAEVDGLTKADKEQIYGQLDRVMQDSKTGNKFYSSSELRTLASDMVRQAACSTAALETAL